LWIDESRTVRAAWCTGVDLKVSTLSSVVPSRVPSNLLELVSPEKLASKPKKPVYFPPRMPKFMVPRKRYYKPAVPRARRRTESVLKYRRYIARIAQLNYVRITVREKRYERRVLKNEAFQKKVEVQYQEKLKRYDLLYNKKLALYKVKLDRWVSSVKSAYIRTLKKQSPSKRHYTEDHEYKFLTLRLDPADTSPKMASYSWHDSLSSVGGNWRTYRNFEGAPVFITNPLSPSAKMLQDEFAVNLHGSLSRLIDGLVVDYDSALITKLFDKIGAKNLHIGNILAERHQTMDLLKDSLLALRKILQSKKSALALAASTIKSPKKLANLTLAFQFGVKPLVQDIHEALSLLTSEPSRIPTVKVRTNLSGPKGRFITLDNPVFSFSGRLEMSYTVSMGIDTSLWRNLSSLGLTDWRSIAWEVTPWSFVADWFIPIGAYINSLSADLGLTFQSGTRKVKLVGTFTFKDDVISSTDYNYSEDFLLSLTGLKETGVTGVFHGSFIHRTVLTELPDRDRILKVKNPYSINHLVDSVALIVQKLRVKR